MVSTVKQPTSNRCHSLDLFEKRMALAIRYPTDPLQFVWHVWCMLRGHVTIVLKSLETHCHFLRLLARHPRPPTVFLLEHRLRRFERHAEASNAGQ